MESEVTVTFAPDDVDVTVPKGRTILEAAEKGSVGIEALCGGNGICGTCAVRVDEAGDEALSPVTEDEKRVLHEEELSEGYRLGCQAEVKGDVSVFVPAGSRTEGEIVMTEGKELDFEHDPAIRRYQIAFDGPTLEDTLPDRERVLDALAEKYDREVDRVDRLTLTELPTRIRDDQAENEFRATATVHEDEIVGIDPGRTGPAYGLAIDIGTTTLAIYLLDLSTGEVVAVSSDMNPQRTHGGDIISRVQYATRDAEGKAELQSLIVDGINENIESVTKEAGIDPNAIYEAIFVGNTAMHHLFLGIDAGPVAASPYVPATRAPVNTIARDIDLRMNPAGKVSWLPIIGGWVGPDFVADLLAAGVLDRDETVLAVDIGTNGEIAVSGPDQTYVASAPAGPALEGAEITHGVQAKPGAVEAVSLDPDTWEATVEVIGDEKPIGICGSGIIDVVAQLFLVGAINRRGRLVDPAEGHERIRDREDGSREFVLLSAEKTDIDEAIVVSQEDIRDIQNAKAAIQTGSHVLLEAADIDSVDRLIMAGGFGNYIDPESAKLLGLYPEVDVEDVEFLGNAAGYGAMYALLNQDAREESERIVSAVEYVELAAWEGFHDLFMKAMYLPHREFDRYPTVKERVEKSQGKPAEEL